MNRPTAATPLTMKRITVLLVLLLAAASIPAASIPALAHHTPDRHDTCPPGWNVGSRYDTKLLTRLTFCLRNGSTQSPEQAWQQHAIEQEATRDRNARDPDHVPQDRAPGQPCPPGYSLRTVTIPTDNVLGTGLPGSHTQTACTR